jgi:hypothetical protein
MKAGMGQLRKITVDVPADDLAAAQEFTGTGVTETVRAALKQFRSTLAQQKLKSLRGKVKFSLSLEELREDRE